MALNEDQQILESGVRAEAIREELATEVLEEEVEAEQILEGQAEFEEEMNYANQLAAAQEESAARSAELRKQSGHLSDPLYLNILSFLPYLLFPMM